MNDDAAERRSVSTLYRLLGLLVRIVDLQTQLTKEWKNQMTVKLNALTDAVTGLTADLVVTQAKLADVVAAHDDGPSQTVVDNLTAEVEAARQQVATLQAQLEAIAPTPPVEEPVA